MASQHCLCVRHAGTRDLAESRRLPESRHCRPRAAPRGSPLRQSCVALDSPDVAAASAPRAAAGIPRCRNLDCALFSLRAPQRAMGETDPAATLNAHPTATGTSSSTVPTSPVCVALVLSLVSSSDDVRTAAAHDIGDVLRRVLRLWKVDVAGAAAAARGAHGPGGCCGQRSSHGESATVDF